MTFAKTISKEEIAEMPREVFPGRIVVVDTKEGLTEALSRLSSFAEVGFDTETRPNFTKGSNYKMSLIQLSSEDLCFLIRLNKFRRFPVGLENFLKNNTVKKIGLALRDDFHQLNRLTDVSPNNFIDLQQYVLPFGIEETSLRKIYAILFGKRISKHQQRSNWDVQQLREPQMYYAALDAWACLRIYQYLEQFK